MPTLGMLPIKHMRCIVAFISAPHLYIRTLIFGAVAFWRDRKDPIRLRMPQCSRCLEAALRGLTCSHASTVSRQVPICDPPLIR